MDLLDRAISRRRVLTGLGGLALAALTAATCRQGGDAPPPPVSTPSPETLEPGTPAYTENAGVRIYYETYGSGPPLLLHHGFASSAEAWRQWGYVKALKDDFQLIIMDARGHGKSDKPHDAEAYSMEARTDDVAAVLEAAGVERAHFWGYSMGGRTGFSFTQRYPSRVASLVNGAAAPTSASGFDEQRALRWVEALRQSDAAAIAASLNVPEAAIRPLFENNDLEALAAAQLALIFWPAVDASKLDVPSYHYVGELDPLLPVTRAAAEAMPGSEFVILAGLNHLTGFARSSQVVPQVLRFLRAQRIS